MVCTSEVIINSENYVAIAEPAASQDRAAIAAIMSNGARPLENTGAACIFTRSKYDA